MSELRGKHYVWQQAPKHGRSLRSIEEKTLWGDLYRLWSPSANNSTFWCYLSWLRSFCRGQSSSDGRSHPWSAEHHHSSKTGFQQLQVAICSNKNPIHPNSAPLHRIVEESPVLRGRQTRERNNGSTAGPPETPKGSAARPNSCSNWSRCIVHCLSIII